MMMTQALNLPNGLWRRLRKTAKDEGKKPEKLALEMLDRSLARQEVQDSEFIAWSVAMVLAEDRGRSWSDHGAGRRWVLRWNDDHPEGDALHIRRAWGKLHRDDLIRALEASKR